MSKFETIAKITPGFGYSVNCQAELFTGKTPDELGYFCEWTYEPIHSPFQKLKPIFYLLDPVKRIYYLDRFFHRLLGKFVGDVKNIPFKYLCKMVKNGRSVFFNDLDDCLLNLPGIKKIFSTHYNYLPMEKVDYEVYKTALGAIDENKWTSFVISLTKLDAVGHWQGVGSPRYDQKIAELDQWVQNLRNKYLAKNKDGKVVVISDHGMANVKGGRRVDLERNFGKPSDKTYYYFLDGTILRIWIFNDKLRTCIENYLENLNIGKIITSKKRKEYGLTNNQFGHIIFVINEGLMFCPGFWGKRLSKGMHGYHPELESQKGILLYSDYDKNISHKDIRSVKVYSFLRDCIFKT